MRPRMLYVIDAILGFGWTFYISGSYSPSFPWRYIPLPLGWIFSRRMHSTDMEF
jgi:hypothetical protein